MSEAIFLSFPVLDFHKDYILREFSYDDQQEYYEYLQDQDVKRWVPDECLPKDYDATREEIEYNINLFRYNRSVYWVIARKDNNKFIGTCGYNYWSREHRRSEISYDLNKKYWNKGIITAAAKAVMSFGFARMELERIEATVTPGNGASIQVLKKLGFKKEGLLRHHKRIGGKFTDAIIHSILSHEYLGF